MENPCAKDQPPTDRALIGVVLMVIAMSIIPILDGIAKHMTEALQVFTIAWGAYVASALMATPTDFLA